MQQHISFIIIYKVQLLNNATSVDAEKSKQCGFLRLIFFIMQSRTTMLLAQTLWSWIKTRIESTPQVQSYIYFPKASTICKSCLTLRHQNWNMQKDPQIALLVRPNNYNWSFNIFSERFRFIRYRLDIL